MKRKAWCYIFTFMVIGLCSEACFADIHFKNLPDAVEKMSIGGSTAQWYNVHKNAYGVDGEDYTWIDASFKLHTNIALKNGMEFKFGGMYAGTFGKDYSGSDLGFGAMPIAYTGNNNYVFEPDEAYLKIWHLAGLPVDVTVGRQQIIIQKGFLIKDQNLSLDTNLYENSRGASPFAINVDIDLEQAALRLYGAKVDTTEDMGKLLKGESIDMYGVDISYTLNKNAYFYGGVINYRTKTKGKLDHDDMTYYLGTDLTFGEFDFQAEYALQLGEEAYSGIDRKASSGTVCLKYTFRTVPMKPLVEIGTWYLSGDDPDTADNEAFNRMNGGFGDWGKWYPGEIFGNQIWAPEHNRRTIFLQAGFSPLETVSIRLQYFKTSWIEEVTRYGRVSDTDGSDELNLVLEWFPNQHIYAGLLLGVGKPDTGITEIYGGDETAAMIMPFFTYKF